MHRTLVAALAGTALILAPQGAQAQTVLDPVAYAVTGGTTTGLTCGLAFDPITFAFTECSGAWDGNNLGNANPGSAAVMDFINNTSGWSASWGRFDPGRPVTLPNVVTTPFVVALKGGPAFSLFYFANSGGGFDLATRDLDQGMAGVSTNWKGNPQDWSHATLYTVPEPAAGLLVLTGLLGVAAIRRRREDVA